MKHHVYSFIFFTRAFLDSIANLLNVEHNLGFVSNAISLQRGSFLKALQSKSPGIELSIRKHKAWIDDVVRYRDNVIHRHSIIVLPAVDPQIGDYGYRSWRYKMQSNPDYPAFSDEAMNTLSIYVYDFVDEWITQAKELFEVTCVHLVERLSMSKPILAQEAPKSPHSK